MKKALFSSIAVIVMTAISYAKTTTTLEERMKMAGEEELFAKFHYPFAEFTGLFNGSFQGKYKEDDIDDVHQMLKNAIRDDATTLDKHFLSYIRPYVSQIYLRKLTWYIQNPDKDGVIGLEEADGLIDRLVAEKKTGFWSSGKYFSAMYKMTDGNLDEKKWTPPRESEVILFLDGDESKPFMSLYCGNPIIAGPTIKVPEKKKEETTKINWDRTQEETTDRRSGTVGNITQTTTVNVRGGGESNRKGNGIVPALIGAVAGYAAGRMSGGYQQGGYYYQPYRVPNGFGGTRVIYRTFPVNPGNGGNGGGSPRRYNESNAGYQTNVRH